MTWDSGPAFPPGTLVLTPEQAAALREAMTKIAEQFQAFAAAWAEAAPRLAESINAGLPPLSAFDDENGASEVHLRVYRGGAPS